LDLFAVAVAIYFESWPHTVQTRPFYMNDPTIVLALSVHSAHPCAAGRIAASE
jgi:hypothetical protein